MRCLETILPACALCALMASAVPMANAGEAAVLEQPFAATRDARLPFDPSEATFNFGQSSRLRARNLGYKSGEALVLDFDRPGISAFLDAHGAKQISARLLIVCREVQGAKVATVEVAILDTTAEWIEGGNDAASAAADEVTFLAARSGSQPWTDARGTRVADFRALFYDQSRDTITSMVNPHAMQVGPLDKDQEMTLQLDRAFVDRFARSPTSQGLILCTRSDANVDFFSREQTGKGAQLVLNAVE